MLHRAQLAIFVGGKSLRMGSPKGLLEAGEGSQTIIERLVECAKAADLDPMLVGDADPYAGLVEEVPRLADDPRDFGPLGGLRAALLRARGTGASHVVAVGCDMPEVAIEALVLLRDHPTDAAVLAPRRRPDAPWEPLLARYHAPRVIPVLERVIAEGQRSFQRLFAEVAVWPLELTPAVERSLEDWDTPDDVVR